MRLLADQDIYAITIKLLRDSGHDVVTAADLRLSKSSDIELLQVAAQDQRIFMTRDRDFGGLIFVNAVRCGVVYLRMVPSTLRAVHDELLRVLDQYSEQELLSALIVVEPARHRLRRQSP